MVQTKGLVGVRPAASSVERALCPPYDVIKDGSPLEKELRSRPESMVHIIAGENPAATIQRLLDEGILQQDDEECFYVLEQSFQGKSRIGVLAAVEVSEYEEGNIIRHEKTFDAKVKGRIALARQTGLNTGPIFLLTRGELTAALQPAFGDVPVYDATCDFGGGTDLQDVRHRVWRIPATSTVGEAIRASLAPHPAYIADGHHRYHAALRGGQTHVLAYLTEDAEILAYNRVVRGTVPLEAALQQLELEPATTFETPAKHRFTFYTRDACFSLAAKIVPDDVVGRLDCSILEREVYPHLGLAHEHIVDPKHFDYYPESALEDMQAAVDRGDYDLAIALHPVAIEELIAVADAGRTDSEIVMPEKSTFFSPKVPTGVIFYRFDYRG